MINKVKKIRGGAWNKIVLISFIAIFLSLAAYKIDFLIKDRNQYGASAQSEVSSKWGKEQVHGAIVLTVPVVEKVQKANDGKVINEENHTMVHFLPETLSIKAVSKSKIRYRGIYKVPLHETKIEMSGEFNTYIDEIKKNYKFKNSVVLWDKAVLTLGVKDFRGVKSININWNGNAIKGRTSAMPSGFMDSAILVDVNASQEKAKSFDIKMTIRGSGPLGFYPFGKTTTAEISSDWGDPSFVGAYLPENRNIGNQSFKASWKVLGITNDLPDYWKDSQRFSAGVSDNMSYINGDPVHRAATRSQFGVDLFMPLQNYQLNTRSVKYVLLFIALTFMTMFFSEILYGLKFHSIHYLMTGGGLVLFFLLLLSLSEHIGFNLSYFVAAAGTTVSISLYVLGFSASKKAFKIVLTQLSLLYAFLFIVLKQEDYALLSGSILVWVAFVVSMYVTRKIEWSHLTEMDLEPGSDF